MLVSSRLVTGVADLELSYEEQRFLARHPPSGVILFARNIGNGYQSLDQLKNLVRQIRETARPPPTIWMDQEGGRIQRIRDPFTRHPAPLRFVQSKRRDRLALCRLAGDLCARELAALGIGVNCAPVLDIPEKGSAHDGIIGDRAFGHHPEQVVELASEWLGGLQQHAVMGIGKHFPGHGAAEVDSHYALPVILNDRKSLENWAWLPFRRLQHHNQLPAVMIGHLKLPLLDAENPATFSRTILQQLLRDQWHYDGLIVSDALEMEALSGSLTERAKRAVMAGCDLALCCTGKMADSEAVLDGIRRGQEETAPECTEQSQYRIEKTLCHHRLEPAENPRSLFQDKSYWRDRRIVESFS